MRDQLVDLEYIAMLLWRIFARAGSDSIESSVRPDKHHERLHSPSRTCIRFANHNKNKLRVTNMQSSGGSINVDRQGVSSGEGDVYDMIVVGTGIGAAGFIRRLKQFDRTRNIRILWLEEGTRFSALSWPRALVTGADEGRVPQIPCSSQSYIWALRWRAFGGGDAMNSGGPNYLGIQRDAKDNTIPDIVPPPLPPAGPTGASEGNGYELRNNFVHPPTALGDRFVKGFREMGWTVQPVLPSTSGRKEPNSVGYPSSIYAPDYQSRMLIAKDLVPESQEQGDKEDPLKVAAYKIGCKVKRVLFTNAKKACGVVAVDIETGKEVKYYAKKTVLAAGVFGTFDLLLNSGIGPPEYLDMRGVEPLVSNKFVGKNIGDESQVTVLFCAAETQPAPPPNGVQSPLVGWKSESGKFAAVVWPSDLPSLFILYTRVRIFEFLRKFWIFGGLVKILEVIYRRLIRLLLSPYSFVGVSLDTPTNRKLTIEKHAPDQIIFNDDDVQFTDEMLQWYNDALPGLKSALDANRKAYGFGGKLLPRLFLKILTPIFRYIIGGWLQEGALTQYKLNPQQEKNELASYQHYYGGCGDDVVDDLYAVIGVHDLHICDATVITKFGRKLLPGAPSTTIMQQGMRVADAMYPPK